MGAGTRQIHSLLKQRLWRIRQRVLIGLASDLPKTEPADLEGVDAPTMQVYRLMFCSAPSLMSSSIVSVQRSQSKSRVLRRSAPTTFPGGRAMLRSGAGVEL